MTKKMTTTNQDRLWESRATHEEILKMAEDKWIFPRRRWRVEGTHVGNSYLLTLPKAQAAQARYGGSIIQVIPWIPIEIRRAKGMPVCPHCDAKKSEPCQTSSGKRIQPHLKRYNLLHNMESAEKQ